MRNAIKKQENHANLAAVALTGIVFTGVVLLMDIYAMILVLEQKHEFAQHSSINTEHSLLFVVVTVAFDALPIFYSGITLIYLRSLLCTRNSRVLRAWFKACFYPILESNEVIDEREGQLGIVLTLCFAPLSCIATHSGYIVVGWVSSHSEHSASFAFLYIFSFVYYFIIFRHLYTAFPEERFDQCCHEGYLIIRLLKVLCKWLGFACTCFWCCPCRCWKTERFTHVEMRDTNDTPQENARPQDENIQPSHVEMRDTNDTPQENARPQDENIQPLFNLHAFFTAFWIGYFLVIVEVAVVVGYWLLPLTLHRASVNLYHYAQLAFVIITVLITYKFFQAGIGPKKILQAFLNKFRELRGANQAQDNLEDTVAVGRVIGEVAHTVITMNQARQNEKQPPVTPADAAAVEDPHQLV